MADNVREKNWEGQVTLSPEEVEEKVISLAKRGNTPSMIGMILRDQYGVPNVKAITKKSISEILKEKGLKPEIPEDMKSVISKAVKLYSHLEKNPKDFKTKRALETVESRINRLARYYREKGVLPSNWRYDRERAALIAKS
ncbi:MAG: 30S ribosomal protein S15 [Candidatus Hadarchaeales archaeon]